MSAVFTHMRTFITRFYVLFAILFLLLVMSLLIASSFLPISPAIAAMGGYLIVGLVGIGTLASLGWLRQVV